MRARPQTAIRGVLSASAANVLSRALGFATHVAITFSFGLSAELDAYFVALSIIAVSFFVLGDAFDSIAVPALVGSARAGDEARFRELGGALLIFSALVATTLAVVVAATAPWAHLVAPGLPTSLRPMIVANLAWLTPLALVYLPGRALGSMLRSRRRFLAAYLGDVIAAAATFACLLALGRHPSAIAISSSLGAVAGTLLLACLACRASFRRGPLGSDLRRLAVGLAALMPIYFAIQLFKVVDRVFASYLPTGAISAVSYGQMIVLLPSTVLVLESVFMIPLAESADKRGVMRQILNGVLVISIPMAFFTAAFAPDLVAVAFQRGRFDAVATQMMAEAVRFFALGIPPMMLWPTCYRLFQVLGRTGDILRFVLWALAGNAVLNLLFLRLGFGVGGLALATAAANYLMTAGALARLTRYGAVAVDRVTLGVVAWTVCISGGALLLSWVVPGSERGPSRLLGAGVMFLAATASGVAVAPAAGLREWRQTVARELLTPRWWTR